MSGLNSATIIGNLGADPEQRSMSDGTAVANMRIAVTDKWTDKQGEKRERTEWISCALFGPVAEIAGKYLHKGSRCCVVGRIATRKWQDRDGNDRYSTEVVVDRMGKLVLLDSRRDDDYAEHAQPVRDHSRRDKDLSDDRGGGDLEDSIPF